MNQSKRSSLIETTVNIIVGFVLSVFVMDFIVSPLYGLDINFNDNLVITMIFTVTSFIRGYALRRVFNKYG